MKPVFAIVALLLLLVVALLYVLPLWRDVEPKTYQSEVFGLSFSYPTNYFVVETDTSSGERIQHLITLIEDTTENRALMGGEAPGREGPPSITIGIYQNDLDIYTTERFIHDTSYSNFKLSDGVLTPTEIGGEVALAYHATGLYENDNVVGARPGYVYMFTINYLLPSDPIVDDFASVRSSIVFK